MKENFVGLLQQYFPKFYVLLPILPAELKNSHPCALHEMVPTGKFIFETGSIWLGRHISPQEFRAGIKKVTMRGWEESSYYKIPGQNTIFHWERWRKPYRIFKSHGFPYRCVTTRYRCEGELGNIGDWEQHNQPCFGAKCDRGWGDDVDRGWGRVGVYRSADRLKFWSNFKWSILAVIHQ